MAKHTGDHKYVEAAKMLYDWEQNNCWSEELGCWFNNPNMPESWKGITVFAVMTKYEAIVYYSELLGEETIKEWKARLYQASEYLYQTLTINFGNINYPAFGTLAFYSLGKLFNETSGCIILCPVYRHFLWYLTDLNCTGKNLN